MTRLTQPVADGHQPLPAVPALSPVPDLGGREGVRRPFPAPMFSLVPGPGGRERVRAQVVGAGRVAA
jgi:hypothetical protein